MIACAVVVAVLHAVLLLAMHRAHARIHIEQDACMTNLLDQAISRDDGDYAGRARCFDRSDPLADSTTLTASCY